MDNKVKFSNLKLRAISAIILLPIVLACVYFGGLSFKILLFITWLLATGEIIYMIYISDIAKNAKISFILFLLLSSAMLHLSWIREHNLGFVSIITLLLIAILTDSLAYFTGSILRGPKLAPKISSGKHWSGSIAGVALSVLVIKLIYLTPFADLLRYVSVANLIILSILTQAGDLFESYCKRRYGVKDSSRLIPGHGGILDRLDAFLLAPIYYYYFVL